VPGDEELRLPDPCLVVRVGVSGSGQQIERFAAEIAAFR